MNNGSAGIPAELGQLSNMKKLNLHSKRLTGEVEHHGSIRARCDMGNISRSILINESIGTFSISTPRESAMLGDMTVQIGNTTLLKIVLNPKLCL